MAIAEFAGTVERVEMDGDRASVAVRYPVDDAGKLTTARAYLYMPLLQARDFIIGSPVTITINSR